MNEHDSEKIAGLLVHRGMIPVSTPEEADLFLLNTCSVREKAAQKVYSRLGQMRTRKQKEANFRIGVVGCVAQQEGQAMLKRAPFVDLVVGTHLYHTLPDILDQLDVQLPEQVESRSFTHFLEEPAPVEISPVLRRNRFRAQITIMEGCNKHCSFCIVPFTRGKERNRTSTAILQEARLAVDAGYVELLLLGQTVNSYRDPENRGIKFAHLLARVASVPGLRRVRFTSPHPRNFDDETVAVINQFPTICNQVHLPVQSGSSSVLRRMRRQYTRERYLQIVEKFRGCDRPIAFSTDVIVGFPGETEEDFEQTLSLVRDVEFEAMFSFKYSQRPSTESESWEDHVPEIEKSRRLTQLQQLQRKIQLRLHGQRYLGKTFEVLCEGIARDGERRFGRTTSNKIVNFSGEDSAGSFVQVRVTDTGPNSLVGCRVERRCESQAEAHVPTRGL